VLFDPGRARAGVDSGNRALATQRTHRGRNGDVTALRRCYGCPRTHQVRQSVATIASEMRRTTAIQILRGQSRLLLVALAAVGCALALAACGGSGSRPSASAGPYGPKSSPASLSRCMRANGVSGFPDPIAGPSGAVGLPLGVESDGSLMAEGRTFAGPAVRSAELACKAYLPPAGGPPPQVAAGERRQALAFARCMRTHGVPSFPDPTFSGGGPTGAPTGVDQTPVSPAFRSAARVCGAGGAGNIEIGG
jgi:hypothetical protein